jgi:hypothetical protein
VSDSPLGVELGLPFLLVAAGAGWTVAEAVQSRLPVVGVPVEPGAYVLVHVAAAVPRPDGEQLSSRRATWGGRADLAEHQPMHRLALRIRPHVCRDAVPQIALAGLEAERVMTVVLAFPELVDHPNDLTPQHREVSGGVAPRGGRQPLHILGEALAEDDLVPASRSTRLLRAGDPLDH